MATRKYELMLLLDPVQSEEQQQETLAKLDEVITKYGGTPQEKDVWGKRRLAYPIGSRRDGYYVLVYFEGPTVSDLLHEVDLHCKYRDEILRHLITTAVTEKSKGDLSRLDNLEGTRFAPGGGRPGGDRPRRPQRDYGSESPAPAAPAATAEAEPPAESTPSAPAESTPTDNKEE